MCGNGAPTGMVTIKPLLKQIQLVLTLVLSEWVVAVAGSTLRGTVACRAVAATRLTTGATALDSASFSSLSSTNHGLSRLYSMS